MFSKAIVLSDAFTDMPLSARCLYFTLGMQADDDGFISNPKAIMRQCGASQEDLDVLRDKRYILGFDSGVILIKHWRMNNYIRNDRYKTTTYLEEKKTICVDERGAYTEVERWNAKHTDGKAPSQTWYTDNVDTHNGDTDIGYTNNGDTQVRLGKDRLGKVNNNKRKRNKTMNDNNRNYTSEEFEEMERDALRRG